MDAKQLDLTAILATLSHYTNQPPAVNANATAQPTAQQTANQTTNTPNNQVPTASVSQPTVIVAPKVQDPRLLRPQSRSAPASPRPVIIDPATIITWPEGLRCVMKLGAQNAHFTSSIRRMMDDQKKHEMRWYAERQALKQSQAAHVTASAQAQTIMRSLGSAAGDMVEQTQAEKEVELAEFDRKLYAAQMVMEAAMTGEMKALGVPFFGTVAEKIVADGEQAAGAGVIGESDLKVLQGKIIEILEDLYRPSA